jgi:hypothetical protein
VKVGIAAIIAAISAAAGIGAVSLVLNQAPDAESSTPSGTAAASADASCPLPRAKQVKAVEAWNKMMPVFRHPRCQNCHGGVPDPFVEAGQPPKRHRDVFDFDSTIKRESDICMSCHVQGWNLAPDDMNWTKKTDVEICSQMKREFQAPHFVDHIDRDQGNTPFIELAFEGRRGLDSTTQGIDVYEAETDKKFVAEPPPGSHAELVQLAKDWVSAQGNEFVGDDKCGCEVADLGEVYLLQVRIDDKTHGGFVVTDSVSMKVRVEDTTITVYALKNFYPSSVPAQIRNPSGMKELHRWVVDYIGHMNITTAAGHISLDFPSDGVRLLVVEFKHTGTVRPEFETIFPRGERFKEGGGAYYGLPKAATFELVEGKTYYEVKGFAGLFRLTRLSTTKK